MEKGLLLLLLPVQSDGPLVVLVGSDRGVVDQDVQPAKAIPKFRGNFNYAPKRRYVGPQHKDIGVFSFCLFFSNK